jgi:hypothetical protein
MEKQAAPLSGPGHPLAQRTPVGLLCRLKLTTMLRTSILRQKKED